MDEESGEVTNTVHFLSIREVKLLNTAFSIRLSFHCSRLLCLIHGRPYPYSRATAHTEYSAEAVPTHEGTITCTLHFRNGYEEKI